MWEALTEKDYEDEGHHQPDPTSPRGFSVFLKFQGFLSQFGGIFVRQLVRFLQGTDILFDYRICRQGVLLHAARHEDHIFRYFLLHVSVVLEQGVQILILGRRTRCAMPELVCAGGIAAVSSCCTNHYLELKNHWRRFFSHGLVIAPVIWEKFIKIFIKYIH